MAGGHRSVTKQKNKSHNHGKHRSKRNLKRETHGKVNVKSLTKNKKIKEMLRSEIIENRRSEKQESTDLRRGITIPPRFVVVVSLEKSINPTECLDLLKEADLSSEVEHSDQNITHVRAPKLKKRVSFLLPEYGNLQSLLDACKVADAFLFLVSCEKGIDGYGEHCLTCITGQGVPSHVFVCQGLSKLSKRKSVESRRMMEKQIQKRFTDSKVRNVETWQDGQGLFRHLSDMSTSPIHWRDSRPYLIADTYKYESNVDLDVGSGTLKVSGYLRGQSLNVNQLIHIPGWGDFQMSQIDVSNDPYPLNVKGGNRNKASNGNSIEVGSQNSCLAKATNPDSLDSEVIPDEMDDEQTWPTAEELDEAKAKKVKTPKGVSEYQQNWIMDLEDNADSDEDESSDDEDMDDAMAGGKDDAGDSDGSVEDDDDFEDATESEANADDGYDDKMDMDEEKKMYEKMKEERLHVHFPDEIDTPVDVLARTRFARYRGLASFQTSPWDPNECLPHEYARIYRVSKHHYKRLRKISKQEREDDSLPAEVGEYVTVYVKNVPQSLYDQHKKSSSVITLFGLFPNEQKMTLISTLIMKVPGFKNPVKSKDPLLFQIGFRRFSCCPLFSEHSFQNKFKMERFLPSTGFAVASMYAPIMFAPAPVLVFRDNVMQRQDIVAKGSLLPLDTNRIIIKRAVLSGAPFKINKKSVVVRYMFFNRDDIEFYKPVELKTKWGKRGHIKQALGTHGHMKCTFNGGLKSEDTVLMTLYKRTFPKWSYNPITTLLPPAMDSLVSSDEDEDTMEDDEEHGNAYEMFE